MLPTNPIGSNIMKRRDFFKALVAIPALPVVASTGPSHIKQQVAVKVPLCVDIMEEWHKEQTIPGVV